MKPVYIEATTLSDAWFQTVYKCLELGKDFVIDRGSYEGDKRLEFDYITIKIKHPDLGDLIPKIPEMYNLPNPVDQDYINDYLPYLMTNLKEPTESYTYGQRIGGYLAPHAMINRLTEDHMCYIDELEEIKDIDNILSPSLRLFSQVYMLIWTYKTKGFRNNQMCLQIAQPMDMLLKDPPCLRHIDTRIQDNKLHFFPYFRSWDLWGGLPANLAAIELLKQFIASEIGVENGEIIAASKGLHLYSYVWELAEIIRGKTIEEFRRESQFNLHLNKGE